MSDRVDELRAILEAARARWQRRALLGAWALGAATAAAMLLVGLLAVFLIASEGIPLVFVAAAALAAALSALVLALVPLRQPPSDRRLRASSKNAPAASTKSWSPRSTRARIRRPSPT